MLAVYRMTTAHRAESFEHVWVMFAMCVWSFGEDKVSVACAWKDGRCLRMPEWDSTVQRRVCRFQLHLWRDCQRSTWFISNYSLNTSSCRVPATAISRICDEFRQLQDTWGWVSQRRALVMKLQMQKPISRNIKRWSPLTKQDGNTSNHKHSSSYWYLRNNQIEVSNNRCPYEEIWKPLLKAPVERYGRDSNSAQLFVCNVWCTVASGAKRTECSHEWKWREALGPHFLWVPR